MLPTKAIIAKLSLLKRLAYAVIKDVSFPLALSIADGRLSVKESKEIGVVIFEAISRQLLTEKLMLVEKEEVNNAET